MKRLSVFLLSLGLFIWACSERITHNLDATHLKCNNLENPIGIDEQPAFSWIPVSPLRGMEQSAYQIILHNDVSGLKPGTGCLWDSGKIPSSQSVFIDYSGPDLLPATKYHWKVRLWDNNDKPSKWSETSYFITGLIDNNNWGKAKWIGYEDIPDSLLLVPGIHGMGNDLGEVALKRTVIPYFRKEFQTRKKVKQAVAFISGLGHYELYINGIKAGDRFLSPGWTDYGKTCYYNAYEITDHLKKGLNCAGVIAGNGFFNINRERYRKLVIAYGAPRVILNICITYNDGSSEAIVSDESWTTSPSPVTYSSIYGGEDYDARLEQDGWSAPGFNDSEWRKALMVNSPGGAMSLEKDHPLKVMEAFDPVRIFKPNDNAHIYDFGQNASGIIKLRVRGERGREVRFIPGELLDTDSLVTQKASGTPFVFTYTLKGGVEEVWAPLFTYYGFRYVQVEGASPSMTEKNEELPVVKELQLLHTRNSSPVTGSFRCSSELFNSIYDLINWSVKSNLASVATDCPHREKLGWLEQTHLMGNSIKYIYDIHNLYDKVIDDMIEAQLDNGLVPDIAPEYVHFNSGFRDSPEWGSACIILPWDMYEWYGDTNAVRKAYPMMKKYLGYLESRADNHILSHGLGDWYDLGPKFPGEAQLTPKEVTATSIYFYDAKLLGKMAGILGESTDSARFANLSEEIRDAFNKKFFDPVTKVYSTGSQTAYAMPLYFGMVQDAFRKETVNNLVKSITENGMALTSGDIGYRYLLRVLEQEGYSDIIYKMNSRTDVPGYGFQLSHGATALTESWAALKDVSNNHMMLGHIMEWFYSGLGGIRQMPTSIAYDHIHIAPEIVGDIRWAEASYHSCKGEIKSSWNVSDGQFTLKVSIPVNCRATIELPQSDPLKITESGIPVGQSEIIKIVGVTAGKTKCEVPSGVYLFKTPL